MPLEQFCSMSPTYKSNVFGNSTNVVSIQQCFLKFHNRILKSCSAPYGADQCPQIEGVSSFCRKHAREIAPSASLPILVTGSFDDIAAYRPSDGTARPAPPYGMAGRVVRARATNDPCGRTYCPGLTAGGPPVTGFPQSRTTVKHCCGIFLLRACIILGGRHNPWTASSFRIFLATKTRTFPSNVGSTFFSPLWRQKQAFDEPFKAKCRYIKEVSSQ